MDACCSFKAIVGGNCGFDRRDRKQDTEIVPLLACSKLTDSYRSSLGISGTIDEVELILSRAAIFTKPQNINSMTICPLHRSKLGLGWTRGSNKKCRVPSDVSKHGKGRKKWPKCDRGIDKEDSKFVLKKTGIFLPVGSGICATCRKTIRALAAEREETATSQPGNVEDTVAEEMKNLTLKDEMVEENEKRDEDSFTSRLSLALLEASLYEPSFFEGRSGSPREILNNFLASRDISPIRHSLETPWAEASERTKRHYIRKSRQTVNACLNEIAPEESETLLSILAQSKFEDKTIDSSLMECLAECYNNATHWSTRRQILSKCGCQPVENA